MSKSIVERISAVEAAEEKTFSELVKISGLDPYTAFIHKDLSGLCFDGSDLYGFNFMGCNLEGAIWGNAKAGYAFFSTKQLEEDAFLDVLKKTPYREEKRKPPKNTAGFNVSLLKTYLQDSDEKNIPYTTEVGKEKNTKYIAAESTQSINGNHIFEYFHNSFENDKEKGIATGYELLPTSLSNESNKAQAIKITKLLEGLQRFGWNPVHRNGVLISLIRDEASITKLRGSRIVVTGNTLKHAHQTCAEVGRLHREIREVGDEIDLSFLTLGFHPFPEIELDMGSPPEPKRKLVQNISDVKNSQGNHFLGAETFVNVSYHSEKDLVKKMRVCLSVLPVAIALFANSPFANGKLTEYKSWRSKCSLNSKKDYLAVLNLIFNENFNLEKFIGFILDSDVAKTPHRVKEVRKVPSGTFREFINGRSGHKLSYSDLETHLSSLIPDLKVLQKIEIGGIDTGSMWSLCTPAAFWFGLLNEEDSLNEISELIEDWSVSEILNLRLDTPKYGLETKFRGESMKTITSQILAICRNGLRSRAMFNAYGESETVFLQDLDKFSSEGIVTADKLARKFKEEWKEDPLNLLKHCKWHSAWDT